MKNRGRDRRGETLFINARELGTMETRTLRVLSGRDEYPPLPHSDIGRIVRAYHAWRGEAGAGEYKDASGFCKAATVDGIKRRGYVLTPGIYVGAAEVEDDDEPFDKKMRRLTAELQRQFVESDQIEQRIRTNLEALGYGG